MMRLLLLLFAASLGVLSLGCVGQTETETTNSEVSPNSANPNDVTASSDSTVQPGSQMDRANRKKRVDVNPSATLPPPQFQEAPENSEVATTMNSDGAIVELRVFKEHSQIASVEATWLTENDKLLKISFRNGEVVSVKTDRIANLHSAPTSLLLEIAGKLSPARGNRPATSKPN